MIVSSATGDLLCKMKLHDCGRCSKKIEGRVEENMKY